MSRWIGEGAPEQRQLTDQSPELRDEERVQCRHGVFGLWADAVRERFRLVWIGFAVPRPADPLDAVTHIRPDRVRKSRDPGRDVAGKQLQLRPSRRHLLDDLASCRGQFHARLLDRSSLCVGCQPPRQDSALAGISRYGKAPSKRCKREPVLVPALEHLGGIWRFGGPRLVARAAYPGRCITETTERSDGDFQQVWRYRRDTGPLRRERQARLAEA